MKKISLLFLVLLFLIACTQPTEPAPEQETAPQFEEPLAPDTEINEILPVLEETEYYVAYASPSQYAISIAGADNTIWAADLLTRTIYTLKEEENGLRITKITNVIAEPEIDYGQSRDITHDGENLWSIDWGSLFRHDMQSPSLSPTFKVNEEGQGPDYPHLHHMKGIAWNGTHIWSGADGHLYHHSPEDYTVMNDLSFPPGVSGPAGMSFNRTDLWVAGRGLGRVYQINTKTEPYELVNNYSITDQPYGLAWIDEQLWIYDWATNQIFKIKNLPDTSLDKEDDCLTTEQYTLPEEITADTTWTKEQSPYLIGLDMQEAEEAGYPGGQSLFNGVPAGTTLTIEPGVTIYLKKNAVFGVDGILKAEGTAEEMITFTHADCDEIWGTLVFMGEEASNSVLNYVKIQYPDDGIKGENALPKRISNSIIRKIGQYGIKIHLEKGSYPAFELVGNRISQGGSVAVTLELGSEIELPSITIQENDIEHFYSAAVIISGVEETIPPINIHVEHNLFHHGFRGVGGGFSGVGNIKYNDNYHAEAVSGSGLQLFLPNANATNNYFAYLSEPAFQLSASRPDLREMRGDGFLRFINNTVVESGLQSNYGDPTTVVEYNNFIPRPGAGHWAGGMDKASGLTASMNHNWWSTPDLATVRRHIIDANLGEEYANDYMPLEIEPILEKPNGIGFLLATVKDNDKKVSQAKITSDRWTDKAIHTNIDGKVFTSLEEGTHTLTIEHNGKTREQSLSIQSGKITETELLLTD